MTVGGMNNLSGARTGIWGSVWSILIAAAFALMTAMPSSAFAEEVSIRGVTGGSGINGTVTVIPPSGAPTTHPTSGADPKTKIDLPPGTYTFHFSGVNPNTNKTETGARQVTIVAKQRTSFRIFISEAGTINDPLNSTAANSGTASNGATNLGAAPGTLVTQPLRYNMSTQDYGSTQYAAGHNINVSLTAGANATFVEGIDMLAGFNGGNATGVNAVSTDGNNVGTQVGGALRVKLPGPGTGPGADGMYYNFRGQSIWGRSLTRTDMIVSNVEVPGLGTLNNFLTSQVDNLEARTEIDRLEFAAAIGFVYGLGPLEAYTLGNLILGSVGNLGPATRRQNQIKFTTDAEFFYQRSERNDDIDFTASGNSNRYRNETTTNKVGVRVGGKLSLPIARGIHLKLGGTLGVFRGSHELESTLDRNGTLAHAGDEKNRIGYEAGISTSIHAKVGPGRVTGYINYLFDSSTANVHFKAAGSDEHRLDFVSTQSVAGGLKYVIPLASLVDSDVRLKTDIVRLGALPSGLPVYSYRYIWSPETHVGVMAQEALLMYPDAVHEINGFLAVDYSKIR